MNQADSNSQDLQAKSSQSPQPTYSTNQPPVGQDPFRLKRIFIVVTLLTVAGVGGFALATYLQTRQAQPQTVSTNSSSSFSSRGTKTPTVVSSPITGEVIVYTMTAETMTVQLVASSKVGNVTKVKIWTSKNQEPDSWQAMKSLVTVPVVERVYARFMDDQGNVSDIYSDTSYPPNGPPTQ